jgi:hypothetical protein
LQNGDRGKMNAEAYSDAHVSTILPPMLGAYKEPATVPTATSKHDRNACKYNDSGDSSPVFRRRPVSRVTHSLDDVPLVNPHETISGCADDFNSPPPKVPQPISSVTTKS